MRWAWAFHWLADEASMCPGGRSNLGGNVYLPDGGGVVRVWTVIGPFCHVTVTNHQRGSRGAELSFGAGSGVGGGV